MADIIDILKNQPNFYSVGRVSIDDIDQAETLLQTKFAPDYRSYVLAYGAISFSGREWTGICKSDRLNVVSVTLEMRQYFKAIPTNWYVLEQAYIDGIMIWQSDSGDIYQVHSDGTIYKTAISLAEYLRLK